MKRKNTITEKYTMAKTGRRWRIERTTRSGPITISIRLPGTFKTRLEAQARLAQGFY